MKRDLDIRRLWVFDFDGTLSPLVPDRTAACLHPDTLELLKYLAADPKVRVAVLSSRSLDDLMDRVPIPQIFLGGGSGLEWHIPGGYRISPGEEAEKKLEEARQRALPVLEWIGSFPGVELEDKRWSVSVHYRHVLPERIRMLLPLIAVLARLQDIRLFEGPFVTEVQFLPKGNKCFGIQRLCRLLNFDPSAGEIVYAGDDENDAAAMLWVLSREGTVFIVGGRVRVEGALYLDDPVSLVQPLRAMAEIGEGAG